MAQTVLVVDDHPDFRALAAALLVAEGYDVVGEAGTAAAALELARSVNPDIVLLDIQLPDGSGFDVAGELARNSRRPHVVLVSSRDESSYGRRIRNAPARGFISKGELSGPRLASLLATGT
jgi:DNA-binding NarL/FixJ family response regulator